MVTKQDVEETAILTERRWRAIMTRDRGAEGAFIYAVITTGIYCRPDCGSRRPRPENVRFFADAIAAQQAGFRPCKRCQPQPSTGARDEIIALLCRWLETAPQPPSLRELAARAGWSTYHLQRTFKAATGLSPHQYGRALRAERVRAGLETPTTGPQAPTTVTAAFHRAGYPSSGRFYEEAGAILGMRPSAYRAGGAGESIRFALGECALGSILVAATATGICHISLGDAPEPLLREFQDKFAQADLIGGDREFDTRVAEVIRMVESAGAQPDLPLDIRGTAFQRRVWAALRAIPEGETRSYRDIAADIGAPAATRAVARACASNCLAVVIPCHRVVRSDGALSGYRWGVERKRALLLQERAAAAAIANRHSARDSEDV